MGEKILLVDDEASVLEGYQRLLRQEFAVNTAVGGHQGLACIRANGPYAVIVSDMRMPEMNGADFLAQVRERAPDSVRMLLTGHTDIDAAIEAVNRGNIFRYLTKPCKKAVLVEAIESGLAQYRNAVHQRECVKKARVIENARSDWDAASRPGSFTASAGLEGSSQAMAYLQDHFGSDRECYVAIIKLTVLNTVAARYGEKVAADYLTNAIQLLAPSLHADDRLFQWNSDVLMAVLRRRASSNGVRMEVSRPFMDSPQYLVEQGGGKTMVAVAINFDVLPVAQFSTLDEMMTAFQARVTETV